MLANPQQHRIEPYPGCPTLAWFLKQRITDDIVELDCTILFRGKKGTSKSTSSIGLAIAVAYELSRGSRKPPWTHFFNLENHVKTVDPDGTMDMFTRDIIQKKNSILLADDISISADARDSMTRQNKQLGKIMTVSRIFQNLIIMNSVYSAHVDKKVRGFADIIIDMIGVNREARQAIGKVYWYEVNQHTGREYMKFFQWRGKRIKYFLFDIPPPQIIKQYKRLRLQKTTAFLEDIKEMREGRPVAPGAREIKEQEIFTQHFDMVSQMHMEGKSIKAIQRTTGLTEYWINKMIAKAGMD
jgi:hypothetical protein